MHPDTYKSAAEKTKQYRGNNDKRYHSFTEMYNKRIEALDEIVYRVFNRVAKDKTYISEISKDWHFVYNHIQWSEFFYKRYYVMSASEKMEFGIDLENNHIQKN